MRRQRRSDRYDAIAGGDDRVAVWEDRPSPADDARHARAAGKAGIAELLADDVAARTRPDVELDDLDLAVREGVGLTRVGHADRLGDRPRRLTLCGHDEVHVQAALTPDLGVLCARRAHDRDRVGSELAHDR